MKTFSRHLGITLPITTEFYRSADGFAEQCPIPEKAEQIRRNTLAVCAVNAYLELMEIPTRLEEGDSWSPMMQMMSDVADLQVPGLGVLSCRAVSLEDETCYVPPEAWEDRAGYVAVVLDESNGQATLLGFTETVGEQEQVSLSQFAPLETLIDRVHGLKSVAESSSAMAQSLANARTRIVELGQWFRTETEGLAEAGWLAVEQLISPGEMDFAFRSVGTLERPLVDVSRAKSVDLGMQFGQSVQVALVVHLIQSASDETFQDNPMRASETSVLLQVHPLEEGSVLPEGIVLNVLDEEGDVVVSTTSRAIDSYMQLQLSGESGEIFGVQILMGKASFEERFSI